MNDRVKQFRVGVVVLATAIIGAILVTLNGPTSTDWIPGLHKQYEVTIELPQAPGIGPNTPVRKNGLLIGRVADVEDKQDHVAVKVNIDDGRLLYPNYRVQVDTTLLGDATIEFVTRPIAPGTPPVGDGAVFKGEVLRNPLEALSNMQGALDKMVNSLTLAGEQVGQLAETMNKAIGEETEPGRIPRLLDTAEQSMAKLSQAAETFNKFFGNPELMDTIHETHDTMIRIRSVAKSVQSPLEAIDRNLKNLEGLTEPLGRNGEQVAHALIEGLDGLARIVEELTVLTESLNSRDGTIGRLIHDPSVYENLNRLLCNSNQVVLRINDLTMKLRPIVDDVRVFTYKIAVEPGRLIGGAVHPSVVK